MSVSRSYGEPRVLSLSDHRPQGSIPAFSFTHFHAQNTPVYDFPIMQCGIYPRAKVFQQNVLLFTMQFSHFADTLVYVECRDSARMIEPTAADRRLQKV